MAPKSTHTAQPAQPLAAFDATPAGTHTSLLFPLDVLYARAHHALPAVELLDGAEMPEPYRELLVHNGDMTPTLERFHDSALVLDVLSAEVHEPYLLREVLLRTSGPRAPVEYGAIRINLQLFDDPAREDIVLGRRPLGAVLREQRVAHVSRPQAFLRVASDARLQQLLAFSAPAVLYGRRNRIATPTGGTLAEIVEILPPAPGQSASPTPPEPRKRP